MFPHQSPRFRLPALPLLSRRALAIGAVLVAFMGCSSSSPSAPPNGGTSPTPAGGIALEPVASGLDNPVYVTSPPNDSRLFVVERPGRIRIVKAGALLATPFLDINTKVGDGYVEQGLLSVVFHPNYATNGQFYVYYTDTNGNIRIERYTVSGDPDVADAASAYLVLGVNHPTYRNHNGGLLLFGPDGLLYTGLGDGGSGGDPNGNGQNLNTLLAKLLRIDVDHAQPYSIPAGNPFAGQTGRKGEIWAYGLRNPWRFAFDRSASRLYIADVGQNIYEEVDAVPANSAGLNYGWNVMEASHCYNTKTCDSAGKILPVAEYSHSDGCSITGGFVYRGTAMPAVVGYYFYGDYCSGWIRSFKYDGSKVTDHHQWTGVSVAGLSSFGEDAAGNLYACSLNDGSISRLIWKTTTPAPAKRR